LNKPGDFKKTDVLGKLWQQGERRLYRIPKVTQDIIRKIDKTRGRRDESIGRGLGNWAGYMETRERKNGRNTRRKDRTLDLTFASIFMNRAGHNNADRPRCRKSNADKNNSLKISI
jgi:hypothetical protein